MGTVVYGVDCARMGSFYAAALLGNAKVQIEDLDKLQDHPKYKKLKSEQRKAVHENICIAAKNMLLASGYKADAVENAIVGKR